MRTISLVKRLKWSFSGNMNPHALVIGDIDNDNENEFVIGNLNGDLAIFKGECSNGYPSFVCRGLGTITCIAVGDVRNHGKNSVVVINAEGHAHIFDIPVRSKIDLQQQHKDQQISVDDYLRGGRRSSDTASVQALRRMMSGSTNSAPTTPTLNDTNTKQSTSTPATPICDLGKPNLTLKVPVNVNKILIADIDNDGFNELILARTDRILHAFQLVPADPVAPLEHMYKGIQTPSIASLSPSASTTSLNASASQLDNNNYLRQPGGKKKATPLADSSATASSSINNNSKKINLLDKNMWMFDGQISSLCTTTHPERPNEPLLLIAQPGNTFTIIDQYGKRFNKDFTPQNTNENTGAKSTKHRESTLASPKPDTNSTDNDIVDEDEKRIREILSSNIEKQSNGNEAVAIEMFKDAVVDEQSDFKRSNYVVKNWPVLDTSGGTHNDDVVDDEVESGAVPTEIVIGKRHVSGDTAFSSNEVGMLSMDGKFSIYDLRTKVVSQRDLLVTHKLFSLATLDVSASASTVNKQTDTDMNDYTKSHLKSQYTGTQTPKSSTSQSRFLSITPRNGSSLNEGSRSSSKISLSGLIKKQHSRQDREMPENEEDDIINKQQGSTTTPLDISSESESSSDDDDEEDDDDYESVPWSEGSENEDGPGCNLFVACAWNGVTYLIDWSKKTETGNTKYQLVKFAFESRVCAFTAGLFSVENHVNVPCLFYVDFEDQIFVYYDVRISPGPVTGFIDLIDDDIEEALDRIAGIESGIELLAESTSQNKKSQKGNIDGEHDEHIDLGDGWQGIAEEEDLDNDEEQHHAHNNMLSKEFEESQMDSLNLPDFIHECLYGFQDMKDRMEREVAMFEQNRLPNRLPAGTDARRLSDLNITLEPPGIDNDVASDSESLTLLPTDRNMEPNEDGDTRDPLYPTNSDNTGNSVISEESSESYDNDTHIASWIEGSLNSSMFKDDDESNSRHRAVENDIDSAPEST